MNSLREFAQFVSKPGVISMQSLSQYLFAEEINSLHPMTLRTMIQQFEALPAPFDFTLDVKPPSGSAPLLVNTSYANFVGVRIKGVPGNSGFRVLKDGQVIRIVPSETGFAHRFDDSGRYVIEGAEEGVGSDGYARVVKTVTVDVKKPAPPPSPSPPPPTAKPVISVASDGKGAFTVTGTGFLGSATVRIRVVDDALAEKDFYQSSVPDGSLQFPTGKICVFPGQLHFSATDGRPDKDDLTGVLWSNTVTSTCPGS